MPDYLQVPNLDAARRSTDILSNPKEHFALVCYLRQADRQGCIVCDVLRQLLGWNCADMNEPRVPMPPRVVDRRPKRRKRVLLRGRISYSNGTHHFDCTIRDLTDAGARIAIMHDQLVPSNVYLINIRDRTVHEARVVWNRRREMGLKFVNSFLLAELADPELSYLKRLLY